MKIMVMAGALVLAAPVAADTIWYGAAKWSTVRSCAQAGWGELCNGAGPGQQIWLQAFRGGAGHVGRHMSQFGDVGNTWFRSAFVANELPAVGARTEALGNVRVNANVIAFNRFVYAGAEATPFELSATLQVHRSSGNPADSSLPGGAGYTAYLGIWDPALVAGLNRRADRTWFDTIFYRQCGQGGVLGAGFAVGALAGGPFAIDLATSGCGGPLMLTPGQEVLVAVGLQLPVNRGGWADALGTLTPRLGDGLAPEVRAALAETLQSSQDLGRTVVPVPEPATWAMLMAGFGLVGAVARQRAAAPRRAC